MIPLLNPTRQWYCPNCRVETVTRDPRPLTPYHPCPKLRGVQAPLVPAGTRAKVVAHEREDYEGREIVRRDSSGRPIQSVTVERDGGNDTVVFAPSARAGTEE